MRPPTGPYLIDHLFGIAFLTVRWYGVLIVTGALLAGVLAARRARARGIDGEHVWNQLLLGMLLGVVGARIYYVAFEWDRYAGRPLLEIVNPQGGGLAIHGAIVGATLAALIYTRRHHLPLLRWLDICMPTLLVGQAIGRWGNFFNEEAYGRPTDLPIGVIIDPQHRLPPFDDLAKYPPTTLFHATFLYESIWNLVGVGLLLWLGRRLRAWLRTGDIALFYAIWYGLGRFWIEGLRTDSLCTNGIGGSCAGALRAAQIVSLLLIAGGLIGLFLNHRRALPPPKIAEETAPASGEGEDTATSAAAPAALDDAHAARSAESLRQAPAVSNDSGT